jgi:1-acyl-sn-glycerol-3-phosphate acyltransferase
MSASATARNLVSPLLRWGYRVRVSGAHQCPRRGPLLVVAQHEGFLDAALIASALPRPVDVLVDAGALASIAGRIPGRILITPDDPGHGLRIAVGRLAAGGAVGAWSGSGREVAAGYLASRVPAPILPVAVFGGGGRHAGDPPAWRSAIDVVVGEPFEVCVEADPMRRSTVLQAAEWVRQRVTDHAEGAAVRMGRLDGVALGPDGAAPDNGPS